MSDREPEVITNNYGTRLLTIDEVAAITKLSVGTLYHFVSEGRIPVVRISKRCVRFDPAAIRRWIDELSDSIRPLWNKRK